MREPRAVTQRHADPFHRRQLAQRLIEGVSEEPGPLARTLNGGGHIRVNLLLSRLGRYRRFGEIWCLAIGTALTFYLAWFTVRAVAWSYALGDISQGQDATPLWIPQSAMAAGSVLLATAFADNLLTLLISGRHGITAGAAENDQARLNGAHG